MVFLTGNNPIGCQCPLNNDYFTTSLKMAGAPTCKLIEKELKAIIKKLDRGEPVSNSEVQQNVNNFSMDDKCLVSNIEKEHLSCNPLFNERENTNILVNPSNTSELINIESLNDFAAKHISDSFNSSSNDVKLPHPDNDDDSSVDIKNGEKSNVTAILDSIAKEIQNSPNFISMPENPLHHNEGTLQEPPHLTQVLINKNVSSDVSQKGNNGMKNSPKKKRLVKKQMKKDKVKGKITGLPSPKEVSEKEKKEHINEEVNLKTPAKPKENDISKPNENIAESSDQSVIKMKQDVFSAFSKEYSLSFQDDHYRLQCHMCSYTSNMRDSIGKHLTSKPHHSLKTQNDLDMMLPFLPGPILYQTEAITELLITIASEKGLKKKEMDMINDLCLKLKSFVETHMKTCSLNLIGSFAMGVALKDTEVDFLFSVGQDDDLPDCLENLYNLMCSENAYRSVISDFKSKRPCIKFIDHQTSLPCNILIETGSAKKSANLLAAYFQLDDRAQTLGIALRYWAKLCQIDQQDCGTLPSFCFNLFLVHFLQQVQPPVLPVLHEEKCGENNFNDNDSYFEKFLLEKRWKTENTNSLGELWLKFFHFYNFEYKIGENVVSIRTSKQLTCKERNWSTRFYAVEDPFLKRNLAYVIPSFQVCHYIAQCFTRTYRYFSFPQLKTGPVKLVKTESFDALKLSEYITSKPVMKGELEESDESGSEEFDPSISCQDLEDHDADIPIVNFISTVSKMSLCESKDEKNFNESHDHSEVSSSVSTKEIVSSPKKTSDKYAKENFNKPFTKTDTPPLCCWDLKGKQITKEMFHYEFKAETFKGEKNVPLVCKQCKHAGHLKKDCPNDELPPPRSLPEMKPRFLNIITKVLNKIKDINAVSKSEVQNVGKIMLDVQKYIREIFPDATLRLFGSFCNGFGFKNKSDMDFCLTFEDHNDGKNLDSVMIIEKVAEKLSKHSKLENVLPITSAKVPIVKFFWQESKLEGDISLYNSLAIINTEMLEAYTKIDPRVQILGYALKHLAKVVGICDASRGSLSSYAYILMVLFFLQQRDPPVIPVLQELHIEEKSPQMLEGWDVYFFRDLKNLKDVWPDYGKNTESVSELWLGMLNFYACHFDWKEYVISIRQKKLLTRFKKLWNTKELAIEDPFDLNHNLGAGLSRKMNTYILKAFMRARERFGTPVDSMKGYEEAFFFNRNFLNSGVEPPHDRGCSNCGKIGHIAKNCTQEKTCAYCRLPGHLVRNCPRKSKSNKSRERDQKRAYDNASHERKRSNERHNSRGMNQKMKNDFIRGPFPGIQQQPSMNERIENQTLAQMGVPSHRIPPGYGSRNIIPNVPPGYKTMQPPPVNYPPPFNNKHPHLTPPRGGKQNDLHAQSPPKLFGSSPPKNVLPNMAPFHQMPDSPWSMSRQGFNSEKHPMPQFQRNLPPHPVLPGPRNFPPERHLVPQGPRNYPPQWPARPFSIPNQPHKVDHRLPRTNSDNISISDVDRW
ncbi:terminal uridylyltransferase 4 [Caerostris darwini]|uniref:Terminal uridylyltransferase 4 n=1 Tax=Caerostris darwini TaxID=1538125 RepID=A0AAV4P1J3_9ARAC|nr:terminal uridylyltransferase 4 [Caerostris darwini]